MKDKNLLKACTFLLALTVICGVIFASGLASLPVAIEVGAEEEAYNMSSAYRSGRYYENLQGLNLSGDEARDVLAIALSQVGYHEGNSESELDGVSTSGTRDFVEYNVLFGKLDNNQGNGISYGYYWCASFVNWCLRIAGVDKSASGSEVSCQRWYSDCNGMGIFRSKSGYIPSSADIIFFKDSGSSSDSTHVGLVRYSDGKYVYTVEGNTSNGSDYSSNGEYVALKKYPLTSSYIVGYASPKYESNQTAHRVDYSGGFLSLGDYIAESEIRIYSDPELKTDSNKTLPAFTVFAVDEIGESALRISLGDGVGYISRDSDATQLTTTESIYTVNYISESGSAMFMPQYRRSGEQKYIYSNAPERDDCGFVGWRMQSSPDSIFSAGDKLPNHGADMTFIAVWDSNYYVVSFKNEDGTLIDQVHGYYGTKFDFPEAPKAPDGYVFSGWSAGEDGVITGNASYVAAFISEEELAAAGAESDTEQNGAQSKSGCASTLSGRSWLITAPLAIIPAIFGKRKQK